MLAYLRNTAACAVAAAAMTAASASADGRLGYHIFPATSFNDLQKRGTPPAGPMFYYGGTVFSNSKVVSVMWNSSVLANTQQKIPTFTADLVNSTYVDQMAEYGTHLKGVNGHKGTNQDIGRGSYLGQVVLTPKNQSTSLTDDDVQKELKYQIKQGNLPKQDKNTLYMVYFPSNITITLDGAVSCQSFGAYHFSTTSLTKTTKKSVFYSVEPECNSGFSFLTFAASHEFAEATTDNSPTPGSNPDFPQAWNDANGFEVGDKCGGSGTLTDGTNNWTVTQYWLNSKNGCSTGGYHSP